MHRRTRQNLASFAPSAGYVRRTITQTPTAPPPIRIPTSTGPVTIKMSLPPSGMIAPTQIDYARPMEIPEQFQYSDDQIREMLQRGQSETMERSGESESGLPFESELEQKANESDATKQFNRDAASGGVPGALIPGSPSAATKTNYAPLALAIAAFLLFGG